MILLSEFTVVPETTIIESIVVSIVGYLIVFVALVLLYWFFDLLSKVLNMRLKDRLRRQGKLSKDEETKDLRIPGDVIAAIGLALYMSTRLHDDESNVLTIKKVSRTYSPWSSKIYGLRNLPR
ncbi:MAG: OadG family protein [Bacteroidia bacterium]|nr:OadG family protein [Bacteroidia bacterium]